MTVNKTAVKMCLFRSSAHHRCHMLGLLAKQQQLEDLRETAWM